MKKVGLLAIMLLVSAGVFAQNALRVPSGQELAKQQVTGKTLTFGHRMGQRMTPETHTIFYPAINNVDKAYVWRLRTNSVPADSTFSHFGFATTDWIDADALEFNPGKPITVDSVYFAITHENNSGLENRVTVYINNLSKTGTPTAARIWDTTIIIPPGVSLSPSGNWTGMNAAYEIQVAPMKNGQPLQITGTYGPKFFVGIDFLGEKNDTFSVRADFPSTAGPTPDQPYANAASYGATFGVYPPFGNNFLNFRKGEIFFDRNGNKKFDPDQGEAHYIQCLDAAVTVTSEPSGIRENELVQGYGMGQVYPNPANETAHLDFMLGKPGNVTIQLQNSLGQLVSTIASGTFPSGPNSVGFHVGSLKPGVYFYTLQAGSFTKTMKLDVAR